MEKKKAQHVLDGCIGFVLQAFDSRRATGVGSFWQLPTQQIPGVSRTDPTLTKAERVSSGSKYLCDNNLRRKKKIITQ